MTKPLFDERAIACTDYQCAFLPHAQRHREIAEDMWTRYAPYADSNFLSSIKLDFHSRFWEMLLCTQLLTAGFQLIKASDSGPEFYATLDGRRFWFEAISPKAGSGPDAVPPISYGAETAGSVPIDQIVIRVAGALREKIAHHERSMRANRIDREDGYIICINPCQVPHAKFGTAPSFPERTLYGVGNLTLSIDSDTRQVVDQFHPFTPSIPKQSGASVPTAPFFEDSQTISSAVLYSVMDFFNIDRYVTDDFCIFHNPNADHPLPFETFRMYDQVSPETVSDSSFLIRRLPRRTV